MTVIEVLVLLHCLFNGLSFIIHCTQFETGESSRWSPLQGVHAHVCTKIHPTAVSGIGSF